MEQSLLDKIRDACRKVAERAVFVTIARDRIPSYVASLPFGRVGKPELDGERHYLGHGSDTVAFLVTLDTVNFGSGYFPHLRKRPGMSGYFTVASSLTDFFGQNGPLSPDELAGMQPQRCAEILGQDIENPNVRELMTLFARAWNDLGRYLMEEFEGSFVRLVEAAEGSAERLVHVLSGLEFYNDSERYAEFDVPFFKRAQILAADLSLAFDGEGFGRFDDLHRLTIFADNLVPHVLRVDGVLRYDEGLAARIDDGTLIPAGSPEEVEIRACALHSVELMAEAAREQGVTVYPKDLDYLLWNRGQQPSYKKAFPRHRTRTVFY